MRAVFDVKRWALRRCFESKRQWLLLTLCAACCRKEKYAQPTKAPHFFKSAANATFEQPHFISGRQTELLGARTHGVY